MPAYITYPESYKDAINMLCVKLRDGRLKIGHNTYLEQHGTRIDIVYHSTAIATLYPDGSVTLDNGGWNTRTTLQRLSDILKTMGLGRVSQHKGDWFIQYRQGGEEPYYNGICIKGVHK